MATNYDSLVRELAHLKVEYQGESSWYEHGSFMIWLVGTLKPDTFVELGSHYGYSYFAACQSIKSNGLQTKAFAIDTWQGDEHAGFYSNEVYEIVNQVNTEKYSSFSKLLRMTFDQGLAEFADTSIDLLHIDGLHTYDAVASDFNSWKRKLKDGALVLFHDIHEHRDDFEVNRFWNELKKEYKTFEFLHEHGLGVLKIGTKTTPVDFLFLSEMQQEELNLLRYIFRSSGLMTSIESQLRDKDKIIETYYSNWHKEIEISARHEDAIRVLNTIIDNIKNSLSWKLTKPIRRMKSSKD